MKMRSFHLRDAEKVSDLIVATFQEHVAKDCLPAGVAEIARRFSISELVLMSQVSDILVAESKGVIVGVVARKKDRIFSLFVDTKQQRTGIGTALLQKAEQLAQKEGVYKMKIRASLFAVPFYLKHGYKKSTGVVSAHGLLYQPVIKILSPLRNLEITARGSL